MLYSLRILPALLVLASCVTGQWQFDRIVSTGEPPLIGSQGPLTAQVYSVGGAAFDAGRLIFLASSGYSNTSGQHISWSGVYEWNLSQGISLIADRTTPQPGAAPSPPTFRDFKEPEVSASRVVWHGLVPVSPGYSGFMQGGPGAPTSLADSLTAIPGGTGNFGYTGFISSSLLEPRLAFSHASAGVFANDGAGTFALVPLGTQLPPANEPLVSVGVVIATPTGVVFEGASATRSGIYRLSGGTIAVAVDTDTPIPGSLAGATFGTLRLNDASIDDVCFAGGVQNYSEGTYREQGGTLQVIAQRGQSLPGSTAAYHYLHRVASHGDDVAYEAGWVRPLGWSSLLDYSAIYLIRDGFRDLVVEKGMVLDGRTVQTAYLLANCFRGDQMVINLIFDPLPGMAVTSALYLCTRCGAAAYGSTGTAAHPLSLSWTPAGSNPLVGTLGVIGATANAPGWLAVGTGRGSLAVLGIDLLIDIAPALPTLIDTSYGSLGDFGIVADLSGPALGGLTLTLQAFDLSLLAVPQLLASNGLEIVICN